MRGRKSWWGCRALPLVVLVATVTLLAHGAAAAPAHAPTSTNVVDSGNHAAPMSTDLVARRHHAVPIATDLVAKRHHAGPLSTPTPTARARHYQFMKFIESLRNSRWRIADTRGAHAPAQLPAPVPRQAIDGLRRVTGTAPKTPTARRPSPWNTKPVNPKVTYPKTMPSVTRLSTVAQLIDFTRRQLEIQNAFINRSNSHRVPEIKPNNEVAKSNKESKDSVDDTKKPAQQEISKEEITKQAKAVKDFDAYHRYIVDDEEVEDDDIQYFQPLKRSRRSLFNKLTKTVSSAAATVKDTAQAAADTAQGAVDTVTDKVDAAVDAVQTGIKTVAETAPAQAVSGAIAEAVDTVTDAVKKVELPSVRDLTGDDLADALEKAQDNLNALTSPLSFNYFRINVPTRVLPLVYKLLQVYVGVFPE